MGGVEFIFEPLVPSFAGHDLTIEKNIAMPVAVQDVEWFAQLFEEEGIFSGIGNENFGQNGINEWLLVVPRRYSFSNLSMCPMSKAQRPLAFSDKNHHFC